MAAKRTRKEQQRAFLRFLQEQERKGTTFGAEDIAAATTYELKGTVKTNLGKPVWQSIIQKVGPNSYRAINVVGISEEEFAQRISVNQQLTHPGAAYAPQTLSDRLHDKSRENFVLALELYNRPSLLNRLEAFAMLMCAAWEQLLKARLTATRGDSFIFKNDGRTKGLAECCEAVFKQRSDRLWKNIEALGELRNMSTHLIMPELGIAYSPIFQAAVINFLRTFKEWTGHDALPSQAVGLLTLTTGIKTPTAIDLATKYGKDLGVEISAIIDQVRFKIETEQHPEFAIEVKHQMRFGSGADVDFTLEQLIAQGGKVAVIEKARDASGDLLPGQVVDAVNKMLREQLPLEARREVFTYKGKVADTMNKIDFTVLCADQKWKNSNNEYHQHHGPLNRGTFTIKAVHWIVDKVKTDHGYLARRKESYMAKIKAGKKKRR